MALVVLRSPFFSRLSFGWGIAGKVRASENNWCSLTVPWLGLLYRVQQLFAPQREAAQQFIKDTSGTGYRYGVSELKLKLPRVAD